MSVLDDRIERMFDDELTVVEESRAGLAMAREEVRARGERADEEALTRVLVAAEQARRAADALELAVIGHIARFDEERGSDGLYRPLRLRPGSIADMAPDAVAMSVRSGPGEARSRCELAARAATDLDAIADLVAAGSLRELSLGIVARETREVSPHTTAALVDHLMAPMRGRPDSTRIVELEPRELAKACRRIIDRVEPEARRRECEKNRTQQLDVRIGPGPIGTGDLTATLPTEVAMVIKSAVDEAGARRLEADPTMTMGAARAWGLADLTLRGVDVRAQIRIGIPVITSAASRIGFVPAHGDEGSVPPPSSEPREMRVVTGSGADTVDVLPEEWCGGTISSQVPTTFGPNGPEAWISGCDIPGVGFIPPDAVAAIATHLESKVSRALLDARTGTLVETSNPRYVIPESMREFIASRDGTCRMWGCNRRVRPDKLDHPNDIDHASPWPQGASSPTNLSGLCRHHHRVKHSPRWTHLLHEDGTTEWISPGGVPAMTFPDHAVLTDPDESIPEAVGSPPLTGTKEFALATQDVPPF